MTANGYALEIDGPTATCGHCGFMSALDGQWFVKDGMLTWEANRDPLTARGPDLEGCCESNPSIKFNQILVDGDPIDAYQMAALRQEASKRPAEPR